MNIKAEFDGEEREFEITAGGPATHKIEGREIVPLGVGGGGTHLRLIRKQHTAETDFVEQIMEQVDHDFNHSEIDALEELVTNEWQFCPVEKP